MVSAPPKEHRVLTSYNAKLVSTVKKDINNLLSYFVTANIIQDDDEEYIKSLSRSSDRVSELLRHISGPLRSGFTNSFYTMLDIMCNHGNDTTKQLAEEIRKQVESSQSISVNDDNCDDGTASSGVQRKRRSGNDKKEIEKTATKKRKQGTSPVRASSSLPSQDLQDRQQNAVEDDQDITLDNSSDKPEKLNLFISYTHKDNTNDFAQRLHDDLEQQGWEVFIDTDNIRIGDELPTKIVTAIDKCHGMIVIKTKNYNKSDWCPKEVDYAVSKRKKLYPVLREKIDDDAEPSSVDFHINFTRLLCASFCEEDRYDESLQKLINSIREDAEIS